MLQQKICQTCKRPISMDQVYLGFHTVASNVQQVRPGKENLLLGAVGCLSSSEARPAAACHILPKFVECPNTSAASLGRWYFWFFDRCESATIPNF